MCYVMDRQLQMVEQPLVHLLPGQVKYDISVSQKLYENYGNISKCVLLQKKSFSLQ